jgi:hypothetical protein
MEVEMLKYVPILILLAAAPVAADTTAQPQIQTAQAAKPNALDKMVCKNEDTLGTRLGAHRVCATVREWKEQEEDNRQAAQSMQGAGAGCSETAGGGNGCW